MRSCETAIQIPQCFLDAHGFSKRSDDGVKKRPVCWLCKKEGHIADEYKTSACHMTEKLSSYGISTEFGTINGLKAVIGRDTCCDYGVVKASMVLADQFTGEKSSYKTLVVKYRLLIISTQHLKRRREKKREQNCPGSRLSQEVGP